jgi:hypothetical protein
MNARQMIDYFSALEWCLWQAPDGKRARWRLAPRHSQAQAKRFTSIDAVWTWWRGQIASVMLLEQSFDRAIKIWSNSTDARPHIQKWAQSGGYEELPDDIQLAIDTPYHVFDCSEQKSIRRARQYAPSAWTVSDIDILPRLVEWIHRQERTSLEIVTPAAGRNPSMVRRL